ncbi:MAG: hypothetical protein ACRC1F_01770 [Metamycoplasmataceae bacterium]
MTKIKSRLDIFNLAIKTFFWLLFAIGVGIVGIAIYNFTTADSAINDEIAKFQATTGFLDLTSAILWTQNVSGLAYDYSKSFDLILIGVLVMFLARIASKPFLMGGIFFAWASNDSERSRLIFKSSVVTNFVFYFLSFFIATVALFGVYKLLEPITSIINESQVVIDEGRIAISGLAPDTPMNEVNDQITLIITNFQAPLSNLTPKIIIEKTLIMFYVACGGILLWMFIEFIHGFFVLSLKNKISNI